MPTGYDLIPVSHDPFNDPPQDLVPISHDPFAPETANLSGVGSESEAINNLAQTIAQRLWKRFATPGITAQPVTAETPGMWSDMDEARRQATATTATQWGPETAVGMIRR